MRLLNRNPPRFRPRLPRRRRRTERVLVVGLLVLVGFVEQQGIVRFEFIVVRFIRGLGFSAQGAIEVKGKLVLWSSLVPGLRLRVSLHVERVTWVRRVPRLTQLVG